MVVSDFRMDRLSRRSAEIISGPFPIANSNGVFGEGHVQRVVQRVLHAPVVAKGLHMLAADSRSEAMQAIRQRGFRMNP